MAVVNVFGRFLAVGLTVGVASAILAGPTASPQPEPTTTAPLPPLPPLDSYLGPLNAQPGPCELTREESALARELVENRLQQRRQLRCNSMLVSFARLRARDLARRGYFGHVTPERVGPNDLLRRFGYGLPDYYSSGLANNVEAIAGGMEDAGAVWRSLMNSAAHRPHLLGELPFYREQDEFGVAHHYDPDTAHGHYWVVIVARPRKPGDPRLICTPAPGPCFRLSDSPTALGFD